MLDVYQLVFCNKCIRRDVWPVAQYGVVRGEIGRGRVEQFLKTVDHEIRFLKCVDLVFRLHHAQQIEANAIRHQAFDAIRQFTG